jgi:membrane dipeptidase
LNSNIPIFDGHNDVLLNLLLPERGGGRSFFERGKRGHLDLPRAVEGGFGGGLFACFVPPDPADGWTLAAALTMKEDGYEVEMAPPVDASYARRFTMALVASLFRIERESEGRLRVVTTADEINRCLEENVVAAVLHLEGAEAIDPKLDTLQVLHRSGLRSIGIAWSRPNAFACGVPFRFPASPDTGPGLTSAGRDLVRECNRLGIMIDLSHITEQGFWDVAALSEAPLVATHSAVHALCPSTRNLTDRQLDAIGVSDGMVGLSFEVSSLREDGRDETNTPLEVLMRHVDYLVDHLGIDCVGFGSDFDGATMPSEIGDAAGLPNLLSALAERGYDESSLKKLAHGNWLRVLCQTWGS